MEKICKEGILVELAIVLMPILSLYGLNRIGVDFGTIFILIAIIIRCIKTKHIYVNRMELWHWLPYIFYIILSILFAKTWGMSTGNGFSMGRALKNIIYIILILICVSSDFISYIKLKRIYIIVAKVATYFILIQSMCWYGIHKVIPGYLNYLLMAESYADRLTQEVTGLYRPTSFFYEPSHYFEFVIPILIIVMFERGSTSFNNIKLCILFSIGILLSTSGMGILTVAICWFLWVIKHSNFKGEIKMESIALLVMLVVLLVTILFLNTAYGKSVLGRIFGIFDSKNSYTAINARTDIYSTIMCQNMMNLFFGNGYGNIVDGFYYPSWAFNIFCLGICGSAIIGWIYIYYYRRANAEETKVLIFINGFLCVGTTLFMGKYLLLYFIIIIKQIYTQEAMGYEATINSCSS